MNSTDNTISTKYIGKALAEARATAGYSQAELAQILGISQRTISSYESGQRRIHAALLFKLANMLNLSLDNIAGMSFSKIDGRTRFSNAMKELENLSSNEQKAVFTLIDSLASKHAVAK